MRGFLPKYQSLENCKLEIENYRCHLQRYLNGKSVIFMDNKQSNSASFLVQEPYFSSQEELDVLRKQCLGFHYTIEENPFLISCF